MSILNFIDNSIPISSSQNTATSTINLTGAFNETITLTFSKAGNMAIVSIPAVNGLDTGSGGYASGTINYPSGFVPATLPSVDNNVWGIANLSINNDTTQRNGIVQISDGNLSIGNFASGGITTQSIGLYQTITLPYICS